MEQYLILIPYSLKYSIYGIIIAKKCQFAGIVTVLYSEGDMKLPIAFDKSHLITIGEKMYAERIDLIRELVNNAYDADATKADITIEERQLIVRDNGSGMDEAGLRRYLTIGSQQKKIHNLSAKFKRPQIGEFGIGKFAALAACKVFEVETQRGSFHARLVFDKENWQAHEEWNLDIIELPYDAHFGQGTQVTLLDVDQPFSQTRVRRYLRERVPLQTPHFEVFLNGMRIEEELMPGRIVPVEATTPFGRVHGTVVLTHVPWKADDAGIGIYVKNVLIVKETFGLETSKRLGATRLRGKLHADFLPIASNRDNIIRDSQEFQAFLIVVHRTINQLLKVAKTLADKRADQSSAQALKEALVKIGKALHRQPALHFQQNIPLGEEVTAEHEPHSVEPGYVVSQTQYIAPQLDLPENIKQRLALQATAHKKARSALALGKKAMIRTLQLQNTSVAVRLDHLQDESESLLSGGVIYINLDHPLYRLYHHNDQLLTYHMARLITKELALQAMPVSATAFELQSELLTEAFRFTKKI